MERCSTRVSAWPLFFSEYPLHFSQVPAVCVIATNLYWLIVNLNQSKKLYYRVLVQHDFSKPKIRGKISDWNNADAYSCEIVLILFGKLRNNSVSYIFYPLTFQKYLIKTSDQGCIYDSLISPNGSILKKLCDRLIRNTIFLSERPKNWYYWYTMFRWSI